jgi:hypothetical protein
MRLALALLLVTATACARRVTVNDLTLDQAQWEADVAMVRSRAGGDLSCEGDVDVQPLDNFGRQSSIASQIVAKGCGRRANYSRPHDAAGLLLEAVQAQ